MAGIEQVLRPQCRAAPDRRRLLADDQVDWRLHVIFVVARFDRLLDDAYSQHRAEESQVEFWRVAAAKLANRGKPIACVGISNHGRGASERHLREGAATRSA